MFLLILVLAVSPLVASFNNDKKIGERHIIPINSSEAQKAINCTLTGIENTYHISQTNLKKVLKVEEQVVSGLLYWSTLYYEKDAKHICSKGLCFLSGKKLKFLQGNISYVNDASQCANIAYH